MPNVTDSTPDPESDAGLSSSSTLRKLIRFVSLAVFLAAALGLFFVLPRVKEYAGATPEQIYWKLGEEILKGLLAASVVALLYDWLLKRETEEQMVQIIRKEFRSLRELRTEFTGAVKELKSESANARTSLDVLCQDLLKIKYLSNGDDPEGQTAYLKELILAPLRPGFLEGSRDEFYQVHVHSRCRRLYSGDRVYFILNVVGNTSNFNFPVSDVIFNWTVDQWPSTDLQVEWLEVKNLRVGGAIWTQTRRSAQGQAIVAEFEKPAGSSSSRSHIVTYEYDVKVIDNFTSPRSLKLHMDYKLIRPTLRVDARGLGATAVSYEIKPSEVEALYNESVGDGTCELFIEDAVKPGTTVFFTVKGQQLPPAH